MKDIDSLERATVAYAQALRREFRAEREFRERQATLKTVEANHRIAGIDGKNAEERNAKLHLLTETERGAYESAEVAYREARMEREIAQLEHQMERYRINAELGKLGDDMSFAAFAERFSAWLDSQA